MATKVKKTTTTTVVQQQSTSGVSTPQSAAKSPGRNRPPSPTMISRMQEKSELAGLNDRLAAYIDRVRYLEGENNRLNVQVRTTEETVNREVTNIKTLYETELTDARKLIDETSKEKAKLQIECNKYKEEAEDWRDKYNRAAKDLGNTERKLNAAEQQVNDLQARLNEAVQQRKHWENEYNKIKTEFDTLSKQYATCKKQVEEETLMRVDLENRLQSMKEEVAFNNTLHEQQLNETRTRTEVTLEETDGRLQQEYEHKLSEALYEMRAQNDEQIRITREETEIVFTEKMNELRNMVLRNDAAASNAREELKNARKTIEELNSSNTTLASQNAIFDNRIKQLETQLARELADHQEALNQRDEEIRRLRSTIEDQMIEYQDLLDVKIALDMEIAAYRKMLEGEETRLNISLTSPRRGTPRRTPMRSTPIRAGKRKRMALTESGLPGSSILHSSASAGFKSSSSCKSTVEVNETNEEGRFIKLFNSSEDKDMPLGGWTLKHTAGEQETVYKFHRSAKIAAKSYVTVWSSDSETTHSPPTDLVMKSQKWVIGDEMKSLLSNNQGEEMASRDMTRTYLKTTYETSGYSGTDSLDSGIEGDPRDDKNCIVM